MSSLLSVIERARSQAISDGQATYVVFPDKLPAGATASQLQTYPYRSFAIFEDDPTVHRYKTSYRLAKLADRRLHP